MRYFKIFRLSHCLMRCAMVRSVFSAFANVIGERGNSRNIVIKHGVKSPSNQFEICGSLGGPLPIAQNSGLQYITKTNLSEFARMPIEVYRHAVGPRNVSRTVLKHVQPRRRSISVCTQVEGR